MKDNIDPFEDLWSEDLTKPTPEQLRQMELDKAMVEATETMDSIGGPASWAKLKDMPIEKKVNILRNMEQWYIHPRREDYEKAAQIRDARLALEIRMQILV